MNKKEYARADTITAYGRKWIIPFVFSLIFAVCMVFGKNLDEKGSVPFKSFALWISILMLTGVCTLIVHWIWRCLYKAESRKRQRQKHPVPGKNLVIYAAVIFFCYLPVFLAVYPGFFVYDAQDELLQVITRNFSTHHPLVHVLLLGGIIQFIYKISGSYNFGIASYILLQMAVLSFIFSYAVCWLRREGMGKIGSISIALYMGLFPTIVMFSLCSAKDGFFTGMLLLMMLMLRMMVKNAEVFFETKRYIALFAISSLFMALLRHNGFYGFLVFAIIFLLLSKKTRLSFCWKKVAILFVGIIAAYLIINKGLTFVLHAEASEHQEMLTVPIQQIARVYAMEEDTLSDEDKNTLYEILPKEALKRYTPKVSDGVKISFNNRAYEENPGKYWKLWLKIGMQHPFAYLNAWFMTSYGFWYPNTVIDVYRGNTVFTFTYQDSSYFGYEVEEPGERYSLIPPLNELYRKLSLEPQVQQIPMISWLFSPGFLFWVMMFLLGYFLYTGQVKKLVPWILPVLIWLTVILGPTYLVRYVVFLWVLMPVLLWDCIL